MTIAACMLGAPMALSAQTWQNIGSTAGNGGSFWNNPSDDQAGEGACNAGSVLTNPALTPASCNSENPANLLPTNLTLPPNQYLGVGANPAAFAFGGGTWEIMLLGTITGANPVRTWSVIEYGTGNNLGTVTNPNGLLTVTTMNGFYLQIDAYSPAGNLYNSNQLYGGNTQFAAFTYNGVNPALDGNVGIFNGSEWGRTYFVGMEDNACTPALIAAEECNVPEGSQWDPAASDRDYNDMIISVTAVPEPTSVALMAFGLAGLGVAARRRRTA